MKAKSKAYSLGLVFLLLVGCDALHAATLAASLDRTRLTQGETVTLTLTAEGNVQGSPDLSPLARDFDILEQGQSTRVNIINGRSSTIKQWELVLAPRRLGTLTVPALRVNNAESQPVILEVLPPGQGAMTNREQLFFLEVEADPHDPYVQSAVRYTVRVFSRVPLHRASLTEPRAANAIVKKLGQDRSYSAYRGGERYDVIERRYAVFPQHSGKMVINGPTLLAAAPKPASRHQSLAERFLGHDPFTGFPDFNGLFNEMRPVRGRARDITLEVNPQPPEAASPWLPAKSLELSESWSPETDEFRAGKPVTRTITLIARGLTGAQLPELNPPAVQGLKVYPDKSTAEDRTEGDDLVATKTIRTALMPTRSGKLTLPEIQIAWWDTVNNQPRTAHLPAHTVEVLPASPGTTLPGTNETANQREAPPPGRSLLAEGSPKPKTAVHAASREAHQVGPGAGWWPWLAGALGFAWLATLGLWLWTRRHHGGLAAKQFPKQAMVESERQALRCLQQACETNDARAIRDALLLWGRVRWPENPPRRLESLGQRLGEPAMDMLKQLDRHLYGAGKERWDGLSTWRELTPLLRQSAAQSERSPPQKPLPSLYPQET
jgi:hypothetical protein